MFDAFYETDGEFYVATELTRGPWDPGAQHAGPPSALLARAFELMPESERFQIGRITVEILRPVPIATVRIKTQVLRPGRRVREAHIDAPGVYLCAVGFKQRRAGCKLAARNGAQIAAGR